MQPLTPLGSALECTTYKSPLGSFTAAADDAVVAGAYRKFGAWDLQEVSFLLDQAFIGDHGWVWKGNEPRGTLVDVGAHIGLISVPVARKFPGVRVHAFEPHDQNRFFLAHNARENGVAGQFTIYPYAVGRRGDLFYASTDDTVDGRCANAAGEVAGAFGEDRRAPRRNVDVVEIDEVLAACLRPIVMKVDVQGSEEHVLRGARVLAPDLALLEIWPYGLSRAGTTRESLYTALTSMFTRFAVLLGGGAVERLFDAGTLDVLLKSHSWDDHRCSYSLVCAR